MLRGQHSIVPQNTKGQGGNLFKRNESILFKEQKFGKSNKMKNSILLDQSTTSINPLNAPLPGMLAGPSELLMNPEGNQGFNNRNSLLKNNQNFGGSK